jgi:hypothetical protein
MEIKPGHLKKMKERPYYAVLFAMNFLNGRLPPSAEKFLGSDPEACLMYAVKVVKGRLPDSLHNQMVLGKWDESQVAHVREYLEYAGRG